jgi:hypothetical protein
MRNATITALATGAVLLGASAVIAATRPPDNPEGAAVAAGARSVVAGGALPFTGTGFTKDDGTGGQIVVVKLDDSRVLGEFPAAADGTLSGAVAVPAGTSAGAHWLRFLAGSGGLNGQGGTGEPPARSLTADFTVSASTPPGGDPPPGGTPPPATAPPRLRLRSTALRAGARSVAVRIACVTRVACPATVTVRRRGVTLARVRLTVAPQSARTARARLTRRGRALLRRDPRVRVRVRVAARNGHGAARTLTLRGR